MNQVFRKLFIEYLLLIQKVFLGGLAGWEIALIIVGSIIGLIILLVIFGWCIWRKTRKPGK